MKNEIHTFIDQIDSKNFGFYLYSFVDYFHTFRARSIHKNILLIFLICKIIFLNGTRTKCVKIVNKGVQVESKVFAIYLIDKGICISFFIDN